MVKQATTDPVAPRVPSTREAMKRLLGALRKTQRELGMSDDYMARKLGIPRTTWASIKHDTYRPSLEFVQKVWMHEEFRDLARAVLTPEEKAA